MDNAEFLLGTVTAVSTSAGIKIQLDGQDAAMSKYYKILITGAEVPVIGERVAVMKHSGTYVVIGKIGMPSDNTGKVNRGGDTMTGALTMNGADINLRSTTNTIGTVPASSVSDKRVYFRDKLNTIFGKLQSIFLNDGRVGMQLGSQRTVDGSLVENNVSLYIDASGTRSVTFTSPAAWRSALNAVNKAGDTMTGDLTLTDAHIHMDDPNFTVGTRPSTNQWSKPFRIRDSAGKTLARIQGFYGTDGTCGLQLYADQLVNGEGKYNFLSLNIGETGVASVNMNHPEAWRSALNALNKSGDTMTGSLTLSAGNAGIYEDTTAYEVGVPPSSDFYTVGLRNRDKNGTVFTAFNSALLSNGNIAARMIATKGSISNYLQLVIDSNNNQSISVSNAQAWRKALGLGTNGAFPITVAQGGTGNTGVVSESTIANIATAGENITLTSAYFYQWGKLAMIQINGNCSEAVASGSTLFTLVSGKRPVTYSSAQVWQSTSYKTVIYADGKAVLGGADFSSGTGFTILATYLLS